MDIIDLKLLLNQIKEKHDCACKFELKTFGAGFSTYIAADFGRAHQDHETLEDAVERLQSFLAIDDLLAHNERAARARLAELREERDDIQDEIDELIEKLAEVKIDE